MPKHPNLAIIFRVVLCLSALLLPLKFGSFIGGGDQANYPLDIWEWLFFSCYPSYLAPLLGGLCLFLACLAYGVPKLGRGVLLPVLWLLPVVSGLIGFSVTTELDYAIQWLGHFAGAEALCVSVWWGAGNDGKVLPWLRNTLGAIGLASCLHGWYQHCGGLAANRAYLIQNAQEQGLQISELMLAKLSQTRIYSTFVDPNVYAAHLLFCMPFSVFSLWCWGSRLENPVRSARILAGLGVLFFLVAIYWTGSRGAALGAAGGLLALAVATPAVRRWKWRWCLPVLAVVLAGSFLLIVTQRAGRGGFASASNRIIYYRAAAQMYRSAPLRGVGLGEFYPHYLQLKPAGAEITRDPHNLFLSFLSQCGIFGGFAALLLVLFPWIVLAGKPDGTGIAACTALAAWLVHSLFQFNEIVPGTLYLVVLGSVFTLPQGEGKPLPSWLRPVFLLLAVLVCFPALRCKGEKLLQIGENEEQQVPGAGRTYYEQATQSLPHSTAPWKALADIATKQSNWSEAERCLREITVRAPHRASFHLRLALALIAQQKWDEARNELALALKWYPWDPDYFTTDALAQYLQANHVPAYQLNAILEQFLKIQTWIHDENGSVTVSFQAPPGQLHDILNNASSTAADGRKVTLED